MNDRSENKFNLEAKPGEGGGAGSRLGEGEKAVGWVEATFQVAP